MARTSWARRARIGLSAVAANLLAAAAAHAAIYTINVGGPLDLGTVSAAPIGDTIFRANPATGAVTVDSGTGRRISTGGVRSQVTITCKPTRTGEDTCRNKTIPIRVGPIGGVTGRARPLSNFTVFMGTASLAGPPSGSSPLAFELAPLGDDTPKTFFIGADFAVTGDDSGLPSGAGGNNFYANVIDELGLQLASDTDKGMVRVLRALAAQKTADLSFGRIQVPTSGSSTITLNAATGARTATGNAVLFATPVPTRAAFTVTGEGGQQVSITAPASFDLTGPSTLSVTVTDTAAATPKLSGRLGGGGSYSFSVGGAFTITPSTPTGAYSGVLSISIDYN
jgi:hypothetical protein